jgi:hypothetical protein
MATTTHRTVSLGAKAPRDPSNKPDDKAALQAIAQAAIEVELFTVPLYMSSLYSIQGMHQITSSGNDFYQGRLWPGPAAVADPKTPNERAFNTVFSVFIQEMLHLQLASNMATAIGVTPSYTGAPLQSPTHGWTCYSPTCTVIPHIIDLTLTTTYKHVKVNTGPLTAEQIELFLAIEQPEEMARKEVPKDFHFPHAPFKDWKAGDPLPMFGTIGNMYQCYFDYLNIKYSDGSSLWDEVYDAGGQQNDLFNTSGGAGHPVREFMGFETTVALTYSDIAFQQMGAMMDAITDQGEGSEIRRELLQAVKEKYCASMDALRSDYPDYSDTGALEPSADAVARGHNDHQDHWECFKEIKRYVHDVVLWPQWRKSHGPWTAADLTTPDYSPPANSKIPSPDQVAAALNALAAPPPGSPDYYTQMSQASIGAIAGVTTVLDTFWNAQDQANGPVSFPYPSMSGSGDRMAICWAVFGKGPDLSIGLEPPVSGTLYHSCQGLDYNPGQTGANSCAPVAVFHSCRGSNGCHAQGGCGFVQPTTGGGNCSTSSPAGGGGGSCSAGGGGCGGPKTGTKIETKTFGAGCNPFAGQAYSAPGDNKCVSFGGCAVPISASQLFPKSGHFQLFGFTKDDQGQWTSVPVKDPLLFAVGDNVHDVAWAAYKAVMDLDPKTPPPAPTLLRLAFPPST